jgi:hypothetical protein
MIFASFHQGKEERIVFCLYLPRHSLQTGTRLPVPNPALSSIKAGNYIQSIEGKTVFTGRHKKNPPPSLTTSNEGRGLRRGYSILIIPVFSHSPRKIL